jgi:hypothetical protein
MDGSAMRRSATARRSRNGYAVRIERLYFFEVSRLTVLTVILRGAASEHEFLRRDLGFECCRRYKNSGGRRRSRRQSRRFRGPILRNTAFTSSSRPFSQPAACAPGFRRSSSQAFIFCWRVGTFSRSMRMPTSPFRAHFSGGADDARRPYPACLRRRRWPTLRGRPRAVSFPGRDRPPARQEVPVRFQK